MLILIIRTICFEYIGTVRSQSSALTLKFNKIQKVELINLASEALNYCKFYSFVKNINFILYYWFYFEIDIL